MGPLAQTDFGSPFLDAPFELEFNFSEKGSLAPVRVVVRYGRLDKTGSIQKLTQSEPWLLTRHCPQCDQDWAFVVVLT